jgi:hypothetical protein
MEINGTDATLGMRKKEDIVGNESAMFATGR